VDKILTRNHLITFIYIIALLAIGRLIPHPPNFTPILAAAIVAPYFVKNNYFAILIPLIAMFISDVFIGLYSGLFWVYGAIAFSTLLSSLSKNTHKKYRHLAIMAVSSSVVFFIVTNFGSWLFCPCNPTMIDGQMMWDFYPKTFEGLILNYTLALPFFQNTLLGTIFYTSLFVLSVNLTKNSFLKLSYS